MPIQYNRNKKWSLWDRKEIFGEDGEILGFESPVCFRLNRMIAAGFEVDWLPVASGGGLALNISKDDNSQDLDLARSIAPVFRISEQRVKEIIAEIIKVVCTWPDLAKQLKLPAREISVMKNAFRLVEEE